MRYSLYLSVGHDEYWSAGMRDTVEGFVARGGNAAFLSGNTASGRSVWRTHARGSAHDGRLQGSFEDDPVSAPTRQPELT